MHHITRVCFGFFALAFAAGCGADAAKAPPVAPPYQESQFLSDVAKAACTDTVVNDCKVKADACLANVQAACHNGSFLPCARMSSGQPYSGDNAKACVDTVKSAYADAQLTKDEIAALGQTCGRAYSKGSTTGGACASDNDCATSELLCFLTAPGQGTCQKPVAVNAAEACDAAGAQCPSDTICNQGFCVKKPRPAAGAPCMVSGASEVCAMGFRCVAPAAASGAGGSAGSGGSASAPAASYSCQALAESNAPCVANAECKSGVCAPHFNKVTRVVEQACADSIDFTNDQLAGCNVFQGI